MKSKLQPLTFGHHQNRIVQMKMWRKLLKENRRHIHCWQLLRKNKLHGNVNFDRKLQPVSNQCTAVVRIIQQLLWGHLTRDVQRRKHARIHSSDAVRTVFHRLKVVRIKVVQKRCVRKACLDVVRTVLPKPKVKTMKDVRLLRQLWRPRQSVAVPPVNMDAVRMVFPKRPDQIKKVAPRKKTVHREIVQQLRRMCLMLPRKVSPTKLLPKKIVLDHSSAVVQTEYPKQPANDSMVVRLSMKRIVPNRTSGVVRTIERRLKDQTMKDVRLACMNRLVVVRMALHRLTDVTTKDAAWKRHTDVARIILDRLMDHSWKVAAANIHRMDAVRIIRLLHVGETTKDVDVSTLNLDVVQINKRRRKEKNMQAVPVTHSNLVVVQMALPFHRDRTILVATVHKVNTNVARTVLLQPKDQTLPVAHVPQVDTVAVWMARPTHKEVTLKDANTFQRIHRKRAASKKNLEIVWTSRLRSSTIPSTAHVPVSGTADVVEMKTDSKRTKNVFQHVNNQKAVQHACYRKFMDHVLDTIHRITTIPIVIFALNLFTADAWATIIDSKQLKLAKNSVLWIRQPVRYLKAQQILFLNGNL